MWAGLRERQSFKSVENLAEPWYMKSKGFGVRVFAALPSSVPSCTAKPAQSFDFDSSGVLTKFRGMVVVSFS